MFLSVTLVLLFSLSALFSLFPNHVVAKSWLLCWNKVVALTLAPLLHDGLATQQRFLALLCNLSNIMYLVPAFFSLPRFFISSQRNELLSYAFDMFFFWL